MTKYEWIKPYINEKYNTFYENNVVKNRLMENDFLRELDYVYDDCIDYIYDLFEKSCKKCYPSNIISKFVDYLSNVHNDIRGKYYGEKYDYDNDFCVSIIYDNPFFTMANKHLCNCDLQCSKSIYRHFNKLNRGSWNDYTQTGLYLSVVSRIYCTNHMDFENDYNIEQINGFYKM